MSNCKNRLRSGHVLEIMNYIDDEYIESALKRLDYIGDNCMEKKPKPKKAKKPLVYTPRVKRMLVTTAVLLLIASLVPCAFYYGKKFLIAL